MTDPKDLPLPDLPPSRYPHYRFAPDDMRAFAKAAQAIALERAAKVCENYEHMSELDNPGIWCAAAIRALISEVRK